MQIGTVVFCTLTLIGNCAKKNRPYLHSLYLLISKKFEKSQKNYLQEKRKYAKIRTIYSQQYATNTK